MRIYVSFSRTGRIGRVNLVRLRWRMVRVEFGENWFLLSKLSHFCFCFCFFYLALSWSRSERADSPCQLQIPYILLFDIFGSIILGLL